MNAGLTHTLDEQTSRSRDTELPDGELLRLFVQHEDEQAFAILARRHACLIRSVCRRVLANLDDVEDAFQGTLLVLARKADSIRRSQSLPSWLFGVAYRVASNARKSIERRRRHLPPPETRQVEQPHESASLRELQAILDEETLRLPEKYRAPFLLCCLQGQSKAEAARTLGWKEGTVSGRLARARAWLRESLTRRGVSLSSLLIAVGITNDTVASGVSGDTIRAVLSASPTQSGYVSATAVAFADRVAATLAPAKSSLMWVAGLVLGLAMLGFGVASTRTPNAAPQPKGEPIAPVSEDEPPAPKDKDRQGDPLPAGARARLGTVRLRHGSTVTGLAFLPTGRTLLSGSYDKTLRLWETSTGKEIRRFPQLPGSVMQLGLSKGGRFAAALDMGTLWTLDLATRKLTRPRFQAGNTYTSFALSRNGTILAAATRRTHSIRVWERKSGKEIATLEGHSAKVTSLAFSPDAKTLVSGSSDTTIRVWNVATGKETAKLDRPTPLNAVALSPDGKILATGEEDKKLRLWTMPEAKPLHELGSHFPKVESIAFAPDGKTVASAGSGDAVHLWDVATGKALKKMWAYPEAIAFSPDGKTLATGGHACSIRLWDVTTGKEITNAEAGYQKKLCKVAVSPDGRFVATATFGGGTRSIRLWESATGKQLHQLTDKSAYQGVVALSPDGKRVASDRTIWDTRTGKVLVRFAGRAGSVDVMAFSPNGKVVAMGSEYPRRQKPSIRLWDSATGKELEGFCSHPVKSIDYSPDGGTFAVGSTTGIISLWDVNTKRKLRELTRGHTRGVEAVSFSPDGSLLASCSFDGKLFVWDVKTGRIRHRHAEQSPDGTRKNLLDVAISPNGKMLATSEGHLPYGADGHSVVLRDLATGAERRRFGGHTGDIHSLAFSADGRTLASASSDTTALVWDVTAPPLDGPALAKTDDDYKTLWEQLGHDNAATSYRALCVLVHSPKTVEFLDKRTKFEKVDTAKVRQWIASLDDEQFDVREKATENLAALGIAVESELRQASNKNPSPETRKRIDKLLTDVAGELKRQERAVEVLESIGSESANRLLRRLADGPPASTLTRESKAALSRLGVR